MPFVKEKEKAMPTTNSGGGEEPRPQPSPPSEKKPGFFTIYKSGQGYWTRLCTGLGAALILALVMHFLWSSLPPPLTSWLTPRGAPNEQVAGAAAMAKQITLGACVAVALGLGILVWRIMNKPSNADFLIATDSEMKKVNWTSRKDLIGSTRVVILFMFLIALFLFIIDQYFGRIFYLFGVLVADAPLWEMGAPWLGPYGKNVLDVVMGLILFAGVGWAIYGASRSR